MSHVPIPTFKIIDDYVVSIDGDKSQVVFSRKEVEGTGSCGEEGYVTVRGNIVTCKKCLGEHQ